MSPDTGKSFTVQISELIKGQNKSFRTLQIEGYNWSVLRQFTYACIRESWLKYYAHNLAENESDPLEK